MASFALMVLGAPISTQSADTALRFAHAAVAANHTILRVFFFHDGVNCGNSQMDSASGPSIPQQWQRLAEAYGIDLVLCVTSAVKRGILDPLQAERLGQPAGVALPPFELSGLGQWIEACAHADHVVTFGP